MPHLQTGTTTKKSMRHNLIHLLKKQGGLIVVITVSLAAYAGLVRLHLQHGTLVDSTIPLALGCFGIAFLAYLGAIVWAEWRNSLSPTVILTTALIFRLILLFTTPSLSNDVYRYMWDGYVINNGISPYAYAIDAPELDFLDNPQRAQANHAWMASPYLPAAQLLFTGLTAIFPLHPFYFQLVMVAVDLLTGLLLISLLRLIALPAARSLIYLWNPLVVVEVAHGAHVDTWMIFLMMLALWFTFTPRFPKLSPWLAPLFLALAILTKGLPILLLAVLFWRWRWWQTVLCGVIVLAALTSAGLHAGWGLIGPLDGIGLFGALRIYANQWNYNSGLFHWLEVGLQQTNMVSFNAWAKRMTVGLTMFSLMGVWLKARTLPTPRAQLRWMAAPFMVYLLLTPTVHPWYLLILLVFVPFLAPAPAESRWLWLSAVPWIYLSGAISLSYITYIDLQNLREIEWIRQVEWLPTLALLLLATLLLWRKQITR